MMGNRQMDDDEDNFMLFEDYLEMSDAEVDRLWESLCNQHNEMIARMTRRQHYEFIRRRRLNLALGQRRLCQHFPEIFLPKLRDTQLRLLKLRIEYQTAGQIGHG